MKAKEKYDLEGYDISGYNVEGWNRKNINKTTGAKYDIKGYDRFGYDKNGEHKERSDKVKYTKKKIFIIPAIVLIGFLIFYFRGTLKIGIESEYKKISKTVKKEKIGSEILGARGVINDTEKNFVSVNAGTFIPTFSNSQISLKSFYISKYEVTQKEYQKLKGENPSRFKGENRPVENVNWMDSIRYANALSRKEGLTPVYKISGDNLLKIIYADGKEVEPAQADFSKTNGYRLPTEAEWEFAARSGNHNENTKYVGSNNLNEVAVYGRDLSLGTVNVGTKKANRLGIYDMSGSVWEWTYDSYSSEEIRNLKPYIYRDKGNKRLKGGSWYDVSGKVELSYRSSLNYSRKGSFIGFRLVRSM